jgi:predicted ATPase with chaperone activity
MIIVRFDKLSLSTKTHSKILNMGEIIANLDGSEIVNSKHKAKAFQYRDLSRGYWG